MSAGIPVRLTPFAAALAAGLFALHGAPGSAATINIDGTTCTIQEAVANANSDTDGGGNGCVAGSPGPDNINLPSSPAQEVSSTLVISGSVTLFNGNIARDTSAGEFPIIRNESYLRMFNVTVSGGSGTQGGGIVVASGARLSLDLCTVTGNEAEDGGGIFNYGSTDLRRTLVSGNTASERGGGIFNAPGGRLTVFPTPPLLGNPSSIYDNTATESGGGIYNASGATLTITNATVSGNTATGGDSSGGGIQNEGLANIDGATISGNTATNPGGGIATVYRYATLNLSNSTITGNRADKGGGIWSNTQTGSSGSTTIRNSTLSGNTGGGGGGLYNFTGTAFIINSTITGNNAFFRGDGVLSNPARSTTASADTRITDSIIAGNSDDNVVTDLAATITSLGDNLIGSASPAVFNAAGDQNNVANPGLGALADNGGPTQTHALLGGSTAINAAGSGCESRDQRGVNRPKGGACDIGAYELGTNAADIAVDLGVSASTVAVGDNLTFTFTLTNNGPETATEPELASSLPSGLRFNGPAPGAPNTFRVCSFRNDSLECKEESLASGAFATASYQVVAMTPGTYTVPASVISSVIDSDPDASDNADSVTVTVVPAGGGDDSTPDTFSFPPTTNVGLSSVQVSEVRTISGINVATPISVSAGSSYSVNGGPFITSPGTILNGQTVKVAHFAAAANNTVVTTTLTIGGVTGTFSSTTLAAPAGGDTTPDPFSFAPTTNVGLGSVQVSAFQTIGGINAAAPISVSAGSSYSINGGPFITAAGTIQNGQTVRVAHFASASNSTTVTTTLSIGGVNGTFSSTTLAAPAGGDTTPDPFSFPSTSNVGLSSVQVSAVQTISGINAAAPISVSAGSSYSINGGPFITAAGTIQNGQTVRVAHFASASNNTTVTTTLSIGGVNGTFSSTTAGAAGGDTTPNAFSFPAASNVGLSSVQVSAVQTISGINAASPISVSAGSSYSINGGPFVQIAGTILNGQTVRVAHFASASAGTTVTTTLNIGGVTGTFSSTTAGGGGGDTTPNPFSFPSTNNVGVGSVQVSALRTITGINVATPISVSSGSSYSISGGPFVQAPGTIQNGQTVRVAHFASASAATTFTTTLNIGGVTGTFSSTTQ